MRIKTRIMLLLLLTILVFASVSLGYKYIKDQQTKIFISANNEAKALVIDNNLKFKSQNLLGPVNDYSCWDEMINYINHPTQKWEDINLTTLKVFNISATWIYNKDYKVVYSAFDSTLLRKEIFINRETIEHLFDKNRYEYCHFFINLRDTLLEITGATVVQSSDIEHKTAHFGYFFVGKFWSKDYIKQMENEMDSKISFRLPNDSISSNETTASSLTITKTLTDAFGKKVMFVDFTNSNKILENLSSTNKLFYFLISLLIITFLVIFTAIHFWISNPLKIIANSFTDGKDAFPSTLSNNKNEFGEITGLIRKFFEQKVKLEIEIAERKEAQKTICLMLSDSVNLNNELEANKEELKTSMEEIQASKEELTRVLGATNNMNEMLTRNQKEITDSISYASLIQSALLTPIESIKQLKRDFFIFYKPHSIVSGDFYWLNQKDNKTYLAVADCTGHGVPGGFMSMLGMAYLDQIVNLNCEQTPSEMLDRLRDKVIKTLHQDGTAGETKDGMDIALCIIDFENLTLEFAGANNPLYIVRENEEEDNSTEFIEIRGDRMPIGFSFRNDPFTTHEQALKKDDMLYFFTDGYQDQISSNTRQKFKRKKLRDLLQGIYRESMEEQKQLIEITFEGYRDEFAQIDDILVFGLKV